MIGTAYGAGTLGIDGYPVRIETDLSGGLPALIMVGLLDSEVREAKERVRTALKNSGYQMPAAKITVSLAPAYRRKEGNGFDLPIAISLLASCGLIPQERAERAVFAGELGLDGSVRPVRGTLTIASMAAREGFEACIVPEENYEEAMLLQRANEETVLPQKMNADHIIPQRPRIVPVRTLEEAVAYLRSGTVSLPERKVRQTRVRTEPDFAELDGMEIVKQATVVAAAGMHNILYVGPPGSGKTSTASRIPTILAPMTPEEQIEVTKIYSAAGIAQEGLISSRPFRAPHHTSTRTALIGGGANPKPGEITLAHLGVLFLDEFAEFPARNLDALRQPMEDGIVSIARVTGSVTYPSRFMLAASMNPCKCGYYPTERCRCRRNEVEQYLSHVSGPLLDRIDIVISTVPEKEQDDKRQQGTVLTGKSSGEDPYTRTIPGDPKTASSAVMREQVCAAIAIQRERYRNESWSYNSELKGFALIRYCDLTKEASALLSEMMKQNRVTFRGRDKILRLARTFADLEGRARVEAGDIAQAYLLRKGGEDLWGRHS